MAEKPHRIASNFDDWKVELDLDPVDVNRCFPYSNSEFHRDRKAGFSAEFSLTVTAFRLRHIPDYREKVFGKVVAAVTEQFGQEFLDENPFVFDDLSFTEL